MLKRVGILTFHKAMNYGAILQCYALEKCVHSYCHDTKIIDYTPDFFNHIYINPGHIFSAPTLKYKILTALRWLFFKRTLKKKKKYDRLEKFIDTQFALTKKITKENLEVLNEQIDCFIAGSDQIWDMRFSNYDETYFLNFVANDKNKIAYAASLKVNNDAKTEQLLCKYLPLFNFISVREDSAVDYLRERFGINCCCVLDPTFLLDRNSWTELIKDKYRKQKEKYALIYTVGKGEKLFDYAFEYAKKNRLQIVSLNFIKNRKGYLDLSDSSIEQFLGLIMDAECVFTTSFHGLALSINLHTNFYFEVSSNNNNNRLLSITKKLDLSDRNISDGISEKNIDWETVEDKLNILRKESIDFLKTAIGVEDNE